MSGIYYVQKSNLVKASFVSTEVASVLISLPRSPALSLSHSLDHSLASSLPPSLSVSLSPTFVKWKIQYWNSLPPSLSVSLSLLRL